MVVQVEENTSARTTEAASTDNVHLLTMSFMCSPGSIFCFDYKLLVV
jgi:hypothetical protein